MRIVLDAMGSDTHPDPEIQAAIETAEKFGDRIVLVGHEGQLRERIKPQTLPSNVDIVNATDTITMEDKGLKLALKAKRRNAKNSMAIGIDLVKNGQANAFVSAGNTGGVLTTAYYRLGLLNGLERPALTALFPVRDGFCVVLDIGANPDCKPDHLYQFGIMGSVYAQKVLGIPSPRVGLLSNGEEAGKGNQLIRETYPLLETSTLNFIGNLEGKELFGGQADVVITDGFTGNIMLKSSEAVAKLITDLMRKELMGSTRTKLGALLAKPAFEVLRKTMDPGEVGSAPLLGVDGLVFIGHGRSDARALVNGIDAARQAVKTNLVQEISTAIQEQLVGNEVVEVA